MRIDRPPQRVRVPARRAALSVACGIVLVGALSPAATPAQQRRTAQPPAAPAAGSAAAEDERYYQRALRLRQRILERAGWLEFADDTCKVGALRVFGTDSASATGEPAADPAADEEIETLERLIIVRGIEEPLDTPAAHDLLRTVIAWEAGGKRPNWDVKAGERPRQAVASGLSGQFLNPVTGKCEAYVALDTVNVVLPPLARFSPPAVQGVRLTIQYGDSGVARMRDDFYARTGHEEQAVLTYTKVRTAVVWRDFAVVAVNRPAEARGVVALPRGAGGAAYIFRRTGSEWRLLTITRTWG